MKTVSQIEKIISAHKEVLLREYGIKKIGMFGSYIRGEAKKNSDIDILIELDKPKIGLLGFIEIENYLSKIIGIKADLVMNGVLKPRIGRHILKEVVYI